MSSIKNPRTPNRMDQKKKEEECFVRFFLEQADEVEDETIQALIDNGYKTKWSLVAMDLVLDLPEVSNISLAQRSIVRKYIAFLQENEPNPLSLTDEAASKQKSTKPNKKRKFEVIASDSDEEEDYPLQNKRQEPVNNGTSYTSPTRTPYASLNRASYTSPKTIQNSVSAVSPVKIRRLSLKFHTDNDVEMSETKEEKIEVQTKPRGRPSRVTKKKEVTRTPSQIRHQMRKSLATPQPVENTEDEEGESDTPANKVPVRLSAIRKSTTRSSTAPSSPAPPTPVKDAKVADGKFMTPAERAIRERMEAKKLEKENKKLTRGRKAK